MGVVIGITIILVLSIVVIMSSLQDSFGYEITYQTLPHRFNNIPTVCIFESQDQSIPENIRQMWTKEARNSVLDWQTKLQETKYKRENWEINTEVISSEDYFTDCNILIYFEPYPPQEYDFAAGVHFREGEIGHVVVFYMERELCDTEETFYYVLYTFCYLDDYKTIKNIGNIVRHEFGHALGLGHYVSDSVELNDKWATGEIVDAPSIMINTLHINDELMKIKPVDVEKLRQIYGIEGFVKLSEMERSALAFESFFVSKPEYYIKRGGAEYVTISGKLTDEYFSKGQNVLVTVIYPDGHDEELKVRPTDAQEFGTQLRIDEQSQLGTYRISASYMGGQSHEITFRVLSPDDAPTILPKTTVNPAPPSYEIPVTLSTFSNSEYGFSIQYPSGWLIDDEIIEIEPLSGFDEGGASIVFFYDDPDFWNHSIEVTYIKNDNIARNNDGQNYLQRVVARLTENCEVATFDFEGYICSNHSVLSSKVSSINGKPAYKIIETWTQTFPDGSEFENKSILTDIVDDDDVWTVDIISSPSEFSKMEKTFVQIIDSFKLENSQNIPDWVKNNAKWWAEGSVDDESFAGGIQFMLKNDIIVVSNLSTSGTVSNEKIPDWIKNNAAWWADGLIDDDSFIQGIQFMVEKGIIQVN